MAISSEPQSTERSNPIKRMRWATQRQPGRKGSTKRRSIFNRHAARQNDQRNSDPIDPSDIKEEQHEEEQTSEERNHRTVYFNLPLPPEARDEDGHPLTHYTRNKIRTAKYTPLSFVPKNLWLQLHNIANVYFIFIVILGVCDVPFPRAKLTAKRSTDSNRPDLPYIWSS